MSALCACISTQLQATAEFQAVAYGYKMCSPSSLTSAAAVESTRFCTIITGPLLLVDIDANETDVSAWDSAVQIRPGEGA